MTRILQILRLAMVFVVSIFILLVAGGFGFFGYVFLSGRAHGYSAAQRTLYGFGLTAVAVGAVCFTIVVIIRETRRLVGAENERLEQWHKDFVKSRQPS